MQTLPQLPIERSELRWHDQRADVVQELLREPFGLERARSAERTVIRTDLIGRVDRHAEETPDGVSHRLVSLRRGGTRRLPTYELEDAFRIERLNRSLGPAVDCDCGGIDLIQLHGKEGIAILREGVVIVVIEIQQHGIESRHDISEARPQIRVDGLQLGWYRHACEVRLEFLSG